MEFDATLLQIHFDVHLDRLLFHTARRFLSNVHSAKSNIVLCKNILCNLSNLLIISFCILLRYFNMFSCIHRIRLTRVNLQSAGCSSNRIINTKTRMNPCNKGTQHHTTHTQTQAHVKFVGDGVDGGRRKNGRFLRTRFRDVLLLSLFFFCTAISVRSTRPPTSRRGQGIDVCCSC